MTKNRFGGFLANSVIRLNRTIESSCISLVSSFPAPTKKPQSLRPEAFSFLLYGAQASFELEASMPVLQGLAKWQDG